MDHDHYSQLYISQVLHDVKSIALVGASNNPLRPSHVVMRYLLEHGYVVIPVNPGLAGQHLLGQNVYATLADIPQAFDMVDIFRNSEAAGAVTLDALALRVKPSVIWMQLQIRHDEAAAKAEAAGLRVVMNRCPKIELERLPAIQKEPSWIKT